MLTKLLKDLDLGEKYEAKFSECGFGDSDLNDVGMMMKEDKEEGGKGIDAMIVRVGLVGGSAARVRKYIEGGMKSVKSEKKKGGVEVKVEVMKAEVKKVKKKKKEEFDFSLLDNKKKKKR